MTEHGLSQFWERVMKRGVRDVYLSKVAWAITGNVSCGTQGCETHVKARQARGPGDSGMGTV